MPSVITNNKMWRRWDEYEKEVKLLGIEDEEQAQIPQVDISVDSTLQVSVFPDL